jgi:hypothetical protein
VDWNRKGGKWKRITAEEFIPDAEIAIMELIDANDLLDEAGHRDHECYVRTAETRENTSA